MLCLTVWSIGYFFEIRSKTLAEFSFWANFQYFGIVMIPVAWLAFVARYTGHEKNLSRRTLLLLSSEPIFILALVWSNSFHHLLWQEVKFEPRSYLRLGDYDYEPAFWLNAAYIHLLTLAGSVILVRFLMKYKQSFRKQLAALMVGLLGPWICNLLYLFGYNPLGNFDLTLLGFTITGLAVSLALLRYHFLDLLPVAHSSLIEKMSHGLLVLDGQDPPGGSQSLGAGAPEPAIG